MKQIGATILLGFVSYLIFLATTNFIMDVISLLCLMVSIPITLYSVVIYFLRKELI
jgi:hypothetical protein